MWSHEAKKDCVSHHKAVVTTNGIASLHANSSNYLLDMDDMKECGNYRAFEKQKKRSEISSNKVIFEEKINFSMLRCFFIIEVSVMVQKYYNFHFFNFKKILKEYQCQETMKWNVKRYCPAKGIKLVQIFM